jgi:hypothetical protein
MNMMQSTPRAQLSDAETLETIIGSARVAPATPSSPELIRTAEAILGTPLAGTLPARPDEATLRELRKAA